jgi:AraC-like DNA-binding protein
VSERHLSRVFAASQISIPGFILSRRLDRAYAMLNRDPSLTIATIAALCGFSSDTYFSTSFKAHFGVRPSEVRRLARAAGALQIRHN